MKDEREILKTLNQLKIEMAECEDCISGKGSLWCKNENGIDEAIRRSYTRLAAKAHVLKWVLDQNEEL